MTQTVCQLKLCFYCVICLKAIYTVGIIYRCKPGHEKYVCDNAEKYQLKQKFRTTENVIYKINLFLLPSPLPNRIWHILSVHCVLDCYQASEFWDHANGSYLVCEFSFESLNGFISVFDLASLCKLPTSPSRLMLVQHIKDVEAFQIGWLLIRTKDKSSIVLKLLQFSEAKEH